MKIGPYRFRPRGWAVALTAAACAAGIGLGNWQWGRAGERRAAAERIEAAARSRPIELPAPGAMAAQDLAYRRLSARGAFDPRYTLLLEFRLHRGRPGFHVVQPLRLAGGDAHLLVLRGWVAAGARREDLPRIVTPAGEQRIEGIAFERLAQFVEPKARGPACKPGGAQPCVWQNLRLEAFRDWSGLALLPVILEQHGEFADGLVREWQHADAGYQKNQMYALQWYSLAALAVVLLVVLSLRRVPLAPR
jgi:surfeit locus 1 family protein